MALFINDTNILIDLAELGLLASFAQLDAELCTGDLIVEELKDADQMDKIEALINAGSLKVLTLSSDELFDHVVPLVDKTNGLSFEDCSVWYLAIKHNGVLLTGDGKLRKQASKGDIEVKGILYVFDQLVEQQILSKPLAKAKLIQLRGYNSRLPLKELNLRIEKWKL